MKSFFISVFILFFTAPLFATHNRAGEITYEHLDSLRYRVTIVTYTKTSGISINADRPVLDSVHWGDGQVSAFQRVSFFDYPGLDVRYNRYRETHTYPGNGVFEISFADPNRNAGVINMQESVNVPFFVRTLLIINSSFSGNPDNSVLAQQQADL